MVDISETSINMPKAFVKSDKLNNILQDVYQFETEKLFDFIIMGEVLEDVEDPKVLIKKLHSLGTENVTAFITLPTNSPAIDHIYLFRNPGEIIALFNECGREVILDLAASSEAKKSDAVDDPLIPVVSTRKQPFLLAPFIVHLRHRFSYFINYLLRQRAQAQCK